MKERLVQESWRTVQLFLTKNYVAEVEVHTEDNERVRCNCSSFEKSKRCSHVKHVRKHMQSNEGHYTIHIPEQVDEDLIVMAMEDTTTFRQFIIDYGKVEVLD